MKRKNVLKFVSLLGIGSFVMLAAASCTSTTTPTPNPKPKPDPMPNPPSGGMSGGMNDENTNPGNPSNPDTGNTNPSADTDAKQLSDAKASLNSLLESQSTNVALYEDYAKIKDILTSAYATAKAVSNKTDASLADITSATQTLQAAINKAVSDKNDFNTSNQALVTAYNELKTSLQNQAATLDQLTESQYGGIKAHVSDIYEEGANIITKTLDPSKGDKPTLDSVIKANNNIKTGITSELLKTWKDNADIFNNFKKNPLSKTQLSDTSDSAHQTAQPSNYSFVGFSNDIDTAASEAQTLPNWNFAERKVWTSQGQNNGSTVLVSSPVNSTDVSWIYSLSGEGTKYTLEFTYYGPSTAYLYFPYKLVKSADSSLVALQYKLNDGEKQPITFAVG